MAMSPSRWSNLPSDILSIISKILDTDVDILRLRSVCSSWRSSVCPRLRPSPFPLKLPLLLNCDTDAFFSCAGAYYLNYTTIYRLSPPELGPCAGDPSDGWLFRVSEVSPNCFALLSPLVPDGAKCAPGSIPKFLNLLNYRITEISKCYNITFVDQEGSYTDLLEPKVEKIAVISNDYDFSVFVLFIDDNSSCWKYGQKDWSPMNTMGNSISDMVVSHGKCYAISSQGVLFYVDSNLHPTEMIVVNLPPCYLGSVYYLLEYKSDLYVLIKTMEEIIIDYEDESDGMGIPPGLPFRYKIYKRCNKYWQNVRWLPDEAIISCEDMSIILPVEDFKSSKGNCVHAAMRTTVISSYSGERVTYYGVYDLTKDETAFMKRVEGSQLMSWPLPSWLLHD